MLYTCRHESKVALSRFFSFKAFGEINRKCYPWLCIKNARMAHNQKKFVEFCFKSFLNRTIDRIFFQQIITFYKFLNNVASNT